jgi:hypothetical protein
LDYGKSYESTIVEADNYNDIAVIDSVKKNLSLYHPKLTLVNLSQVDRKGHDKIWDEYLSAIKQADSLVYDLWNFIQSDPIYKNKTTLIITNDHGRHTTDFTAHGDNCEGCSHVMGLMIGPETPINEVDTTRRRLIDIAPTVASLLNFKTPLSEGERIDIFQKPTAVSSAKTIVKKFSLKQNYPNPFNPNTVIEFYIPEEGFTSLIIYDILGREAAQLLNEELDAGFYSFEFSGANLTSGIYFYRLQSNELVEVKKMSLIK